MDLKTDTGQSNDYSLFLNWDDHDLALFGDSNLALDLSDFQFPSIENAFTSTLHDLSESSNTQNLDAFLDNEIINSQQTPYISPYSLSEAPSEHQLLSTLIGNQQGYAVENACEIEVNRGQFARYSPPTPEETKRNLEESIFIFSASTDEVVVPRRRKCFSPRRKKEIATNRKIGVCIQCRLKKISCSFGIPCNHCVKCAGSLKLGKEICLRQSLLATRFGNIGIDLLQLSQIKQGLETLEISFATGISSTILMYYSQSWRRRYEPIPFEAFVQLPVIYFQHPNLHPSQAIIDMNYYCWQYYEVRNIPFAIVPGSIPSVETLLESYELTRWDHFSIDGPFERLFKAIMIFIRTYCNSSSRLPLQNLLAKSIRLRRLFNLYRQTPWVILSEENNGTGGMSSTMTAQLRVVICQAMEELEIEILSRIDKIAQSREGIGRQNPLAMWACLWILILSYKEHMVYTKSFMGRDEELYLLTRHIYNNLTSIYYALYKTTSPMTLDWRKNEVAEMLGRDPELIRMLCDIKTEIFWLYADRNSLLPEDTVFKALVVENESKLIVAHIKAAKEQGIL